MSRVRRKPVLPYANNKDADQPLSLISVFVIRCLDSLIDLVAISEISCLQLASVPEQACLGLTWSQTPKTRFLMTRSKSLNMLDLAIVFCIAGSFTFDSIFINL